MNQLLQRGAALVPAAVLAALVLASCGGAGLGDGASSSAVVSPADEQLIDLASTLRDNGLESVASAVAEADLGALAETAQYTFFAPNDEAFRALDADALADLLTDTAQLDDVLRNHLVASVVSADMLRPDTTLATVSGRTLEVATDGETLSVGGATVVQTDIAVGDSIVHVVDRLIVDDGQ